jgi:hypothetical protein
MVKKISSQGLWLLLIKIKDIWKKYWPEIIGATLVAALWVGFSEYLTNPIRVDYQSYIDLAKQISNGNLLDGISGYWSPLIIFLVSLLRFGGLDFSIAFMAVTATSLIVIPFVIRPLLIRFGFRQTERMLVLLYILPILCSLGLWWFGPDLLSLVFLVIVTKYFLEFLEGTSVTKFSGLFFGLSLGISYFAKYYNMYFGVFLLGCLIVIYISKLFQKKSVPVKQLLISIIIFTGLLGVWAFIMNKKYPNNPSGVLVTARYIQDVFAPGSVGHPIHEGLHTPPFEGAFSAWTDPVSLSQKKVWRHLSVREKFLKKKELIFTNLSQEVAGIIALYLFPLLGLIIIALVSLGSFKELPTARKIFKKNEKSFLILILIASVYVGGYTLAVVSLRLVIYAVVIFIIVLSSIFLAIHRVLLTKAHNYWYIYSLAFVLLFVFVILSMYTLGPYTVSRTIAIDAQRSQHLRISQVLPLFHKGDRFASALANNDDDYGGVFGVVQSFGEGYVFLGAFAEPHTVDNIVKQAEKFDVNGIFIWAEGFDVEDWDRRGWSVVPRDYHYSNQDNKRIFLLLRKD